MRIFICGDCAVEEGELHEVGCDMETCPICKEQLLSCGHDWNELTNNQREPYFYDGFSCPRCGEFMPDIKMISKEDWKFVCGITYDTDCLLCESCMKFIKEKREKN